MRIPAKADYAVRAMAELAAAPAGELITADTVAGEPPGDIARLAKTPDAWVAH